MKRALTLAFVLIMAVCLAVSAQAAAPKGGYVLLDSMKTIPVSAADITLPEGLAPTARITDFSVENGVVKLALGVSYLRVKLYQFYAYRIPFTMVKAI